MSGPLELPKPKRRPARPARELAKDAAARTAQTAKNTAVVVWSPRTLALLAIAIQLACLYGFDPRPALNAFGLPEPVTSAGCCSKFVGEAQQPPPPPTPTHL